MSDDTQGVINSATVEQSSSPEPQTVPKYRLDEEIAVKRQLQEQLSLAQQMLRQAIPSNRPVAGPEEEAPWLKALKDENPNAYKAFKLQDRRQREQSAATFQVMDRQDRSEFLTEFGQEAGARLPEVEQKLEELRQRGIHHFNRGQIYLHLEGVDTVKNKRQKTTQVVKAPVAQAAVVAPTVDVPSSEPRSAGTLTSGSAGTQRTESLEELEKRLENEVF